MNGELSQFWLDPEDLQLLVYSAVAFNLSMKARDNRPDVDKDRLWDACERVGPKVGIGVNRHGTFEPPLDSIQS